MDIMNGIFNRYGMIDEPHLTLTRRCKYAIQDLQPRLQNEIVWIKIHFYAEIYEHMCNNEVSNSLREPGYG